MNLVDLVDKFRVIEIVKWDVFSLKIVFLCLTSALIIDFFKLFDMDFDFEFHLSFKIFEESLELKLVSCQSVALGHSLEHSDVLIHQVLENKEVVDQRRQLHKRQAAPIVRHFAIFYISV